MKTKFLILVGFIIALVCLSSCSKKDKNEPTNEETKYTTVFVDADHITSIVIYDSKGNKTGQGSYRGTYRVPCYGKMIIKWKDSIGYDLHGNEVHGHEFWKSYSYTLSVHDEVEIKIELNWDGSVDFK